MATRGGFLVGDHNIRPRRPVRYVASKQTKSTKRKKKKPEWDSTVNDLNVHKATREEQIKRHELHKSKNAGKVHLASQVKDRSLNSTMQTPDTVERRKLAIIQEVLYGQDKFQDVLSESDKAMSVVKDLFGDDPKKVMGFPNITAAPSNALNGKENRFLAGPVAEMPETPTHLSLLSDSVMRTPALNELPDDNNHDELSPGTPPPGPERKTASSFQPMLDLRRFQQYVAEEQNKYLENHTPHSNAVHGSGIVPPHESIAAGQSTIPSTDGVKTIEEGSGLIHGGRGSDHVAQRSSFPMVADHASQPPSFLSQESANTVIAGGPNFVKPVSMGESTRNNSIPSNVRVQSSRSGSVPLPAQQPRPSKPDTRPAKPSHNPTSTSSSSGLRSLDDLKKMVEDLETEVAAYEFETGRQQTKLTSPSVGSFSGYTASLITAVTKLMGYLKESEIQRKAEMVMREQVLQGFQEQRALVDALTNDILHTQEQNLALQYELLEYRKNTDEQLQYLKRELFAVLRSHEYQALSSSINTLYNLNPVALRQGAFDALHPSQHENHSLEYLPEAPVSQAYEKQEQEVTKTTGSGRDLAADSRNKPSLIPLATSQDHNMPHHSALSRMAGSPVSHKHNPPVTSSSYMQPHVQSSMEDYNTQQHSQSVVPTVVPATQLPHNGHVPLMYPYSASFSLDHGMPNHGQISSSIVMYPPSQAHFTQASNRQATTTQPQTIVPGVPNIHVPLIQDQLAPPGSKVVSTQSSSASPLYSSHQQLPGKPSMNAPVQVQTAQPPVGQQSAVFDTMQPMPGVPQGIPIPPQAASHRLSHEMPPARPEEDSRLTSPRHFKNPEPIRQGAAAAAVTSTDVSDLKENQEHPPQPVYIQAAPKMEHASKFRGFTPVSRAMIGGLPANHQLRERLQNLANRQKTSASKTGSQVAVSVHHNKGESKEVQPPRPSSPHVHFQDPPVSMNGLDSSKQQQHSPPVSPIPYKNPAVLRSIAPPDKRVVVNLPNAWSDVSSTISL